MYSRLWPKFIFDAARAHPTLVPLAVYDRAACGYSEPGVPMIGFVMYGSTVASARFFAS
jgi:hypothetical protein